MVVVMKDLQMQPIADGHTVQGETRCKVADVAYANVFRRSADVNIVHHDTKSL